MKKPEWRDSFGLSDWQRYLTHAEINALKDAARALPANPLVVNIGAGAGTATLAILEERADALIFSIDLRTNEAEYATNEHLRLKETGWDQRGNVIRVWGDSHLVGKCWRFPIDLLIVDGDHSLEGVRGDVELWLPFLKADGYIALHDYGRAEWPAVKEYIDGRFPGVRAYRQSDTIILFHGADIPGVGK
jgi:predicted O-methyltransferase YrrM